MRTSRLCRVCGSEFYPSSGQIKAGTGIYCSKKCYGKAIRNKPLTQPRPQRSYADSDKCKMEFLRKVNRTDECWEWMGAKSGNGYGMFYVSGKLEHAHRVAFKLFVGPLERDMHIHHRCNHRYCVNPDHLTALSQADHNLIGDVISARNARKTHCPKGHPYDADNTMIEQLPNGRTGRKCRACGRERANRYYRTLKERLTTHERI